MTVNDYLKGILKSETLDPEGIELKALEIEETKVRGILERHFSEKKPLVKTGGSRAKGTMIKSSYDLDITCYFDREGAEEGSTLEEIFNNVKEALKPYYFVTPKTTSLRLESKDSANNRGKYTHIDVVPGRFIESDPKSDDVNLHQENGKRSLKTNLQVHIDKIKSSGLTEVIRLVKIWKVRNSLQMKTFVLELLVIKVLEGEDPRDLEKCLKIFWETMQDPNTLLSVVDPANETGNSLSEVLSQNRRLLANLSIEALNEVEDDSWDNIFGEDFSGAGHPQLVTAPVTRDEGEQFLSDFGITENLQYDLKLDANVSQNGFRLFRLLGTRNPLKKKCKLDFSITGNFPDDCEIKWKVKNYGVEAKNIRQLRGEITDDAGFRHKEESTKYDGSHYVEAYAILNDVCVAKNRISVPISESF